MTNKQPHPLRIAEELDCHNASLDRQAAKAIRTQHTDLLRKDALLRQCLKHVASNISMTSDGTEAEELYDAIKEELQ